MFFFYTHTHTHTCTPRCINYRVVLILRVCDPWCIVVYNYTCNYVNRATYTIVDGAICLFFGLFVIIEYTRSRDTKWVTIETIWISVAWIWPWIRYQRLKKSVANSFFYQYLLIRCLMSYFPSIIIQDVFFCFFYSFFFFSSASDKPNYSWSLACRKLDNADHPTSAIYAYSF